MRNKVKCIKCNFEDSVKDFDRAILDIVHRFSNENENDLAILYIYAKRKSDNVETLCKWSYIDNEMKSINPEDIIYLAFMKGKGFI